MALTVNNVFFLNPLKPELLFVIQYLRIQAVPQRELHTSPLQSKTG
jgi:hypothetical protein